MVMMDILRRKKKEELIIFVVDEIDTLDKALEY